MSLKNLFAKQNRTVEKAKEIKFGYLLTAVALFGAFWFGFENTSGGILIATSMVIFLLTLLKPKTFSLPLKIWLKFGEVLSKIVSPFIIFCIFFFVFVPFGICGRLFGYDPFNQKDRNTRTTTWVAVTSSNSSMKNQF
jgi:hypothetical protein